MVITEITNREEVSVWGKTAQTSEMLSDVTDTLCLTPSTQLPDKIIRVRWASYSNS